MFEWNQNLRSKRADDEKQTKAMLFGEWALLCDRLEIKKKRILDSTSNSKFFENILLTSSNQFVELP